MIYKLVVPIWTNKFHNIEYYCERDKPPTKEEWIELIKHKQPSYWIETIDTLEGNEFPVLPDHCSYTAIQCAFSTCSTVNIEHWRLWVW
jgi:hypothetical protein